MRANNTRITGTSLKVTLAKTLQNWKGDVQYCSLRSRVFKPITDPRNLLKYYERKPDVRALSK
jgi:hypothetical protein